MPRKQPAAPQTSSEVALDGNESYLDNFLNSVIDEANLPGELKRYLGQLRELDTQSQELFERMQRLSKNHIAKAKRSVQDGREPDEEYLAKARRTYRELVDIDEEKVSLAEQMHVEVTKHFSHCSSELRKFEEELKEKGQLKTPQMKTQLARQDSASNDADAAGAASSFAAAGDAVPLAAAVAAGRRGRQGSMGGTGSGGQPEQPTSANSHKRGRGRKVSFKEAERQRAVAEAMAEERVAPPPSVQGFHYNDSELPVAPREECNLPLCGAVPAAPDYMIPDGSKVCAKPPSNKMQPQDWILATILRYSPATNKYTILDEDDADADPWAESSGPPKDYLVEFEDESEESGRSAPMRVPTKYILRMPV
ncbi:hypothetical protein Ctob_008309 [Chrysochromulina tobinii]|uniref:SGF29 C-terminal domain-containing protein n=1 Tax=Chrysochromulina tobinii TaxID=1460289 RepID=A0A0M0JIE5_9EUKA|nr:hypothetical protein Ctob_008309 [Chrysochromulina tobinii]|eukprot:KOO26260.1 hypothetical protein Ctob_008309 [Chrysochromulina sp. CCMP291]